MHDPGCGGGVGERAGLGQIDSERPMPVGKNLNVWTLAETSEGVQYQFLEKNAV